METEPKRGIPLSRRKYLIVLLSSAGTLAGGAIVGAVISDAYTRAVNIATKRPAEPVVDTYPSGFGFKQHWSGSLLPPQVARTESPPQGFDDELAEWTSKRQGIDAQTTALLSVTSPDGAVVLRDIRIRVESREAPAKGAFVGPNGAGDYAQFHVYADLDKDPVQAFRDSISGDWDLPMSLGPDDTVEIQVTARAEESRVLWWLELEYSSGGAVKTSKVGNNGKPFETSATSQATHHWQWATRRWIEGPPG